jgi:hypothetical protein
MILVNYLIGIAYLLADAAVRRGGMSDQERAKMWLWILGGLVFLGLLPVIWPFFVPYLGLLFLGVFIHLIGVSMGYNWERELNWLFGAGCVAITGFYLLAALGVFVRLIKSIGGPKENSKDTGGAQQDSNGTRCSNDDSYNRSEEDNARSGGGTSAASSPPCPWEILGIAKNASKEEISRAYKQKMMQNHPDKVASLDPQIQHFATERTKLIKEAYEKLAS